jgi:hypothetical protein
MEKRREDALMGAARPGPARRRYRCTSALQTGQAQL